LLVQVERGEQLEPLVQLAVWEMLVKQVIYITYYVCLTAFFPGQPV